MTFEVTILGSNSALPAHGRHPTSQVVNIRDRLFLVDCGEGTQMQLLRYNIRFHKIDHIFISHLHGDHYFGLVGLITSFQLNGRSKALHIYSPLGLEEIIQLQLKVSNTVLMYELHFHPFAPTMGEVILDNDFLTVTTLELQHRIPCAGFVFREKRRERNIIKEQIAKYKIPVALMQDLKEGKDFKTASGELIRNEVLTKAPPPERSYAFCTDTAYNEGVIPFIKNADLLYHEATFTQEQEDRARETFHCTAAQAATIAQKAGVRQLLLGHFSARYKALSPLSKEAKAIFPATFLAKEGGVFSISQTEGFE